ncbi:MAG TPA: hypothetical protein EYN03_01480 [Planctomycetes bacterium]|nr:hypothetical protein [Planctomycetaceae bacterium]HIN94289.1 hypothetical protein [Planctomycetota bacterium]
MFSKFVIASLVGLGLGIGVGSVPVLQDHLHWNIWVFVPISGLVLGMLFGWVQFTCSSLLNLRVSTRIAFAFGLVSALAYLGTDLGQYLTLTVAVSEPTEVLSGQTPIRQLISFPEYLRLEYGSRFIKTGTFGNEDVGYQLGQVGTTVTIVVDFLACFLVAFATALVMDDTFPWCQACNRYQCKTTSTKILFADEDRLYDVLDKTTELLLEQSDHVKVNAYLDLVAAEQYLVKPGDATQILSVTNYACNQCDNKTMVGKVLVKTGKNFSEAKDLDFMLSGTS